ncbi:MAG TPA: amidase family protein, partial [Actinomycetota bacterium]|nr:amidase family protein [Actinomycetota bacterium]
MTVADGELETAAEMSAAVHEGEVSPSDLVERSVRRAEAWQATTNAFCSLWGDEAVDVAGSVAPGGARPSGLPIAVKDLYDVAGRETTGCCRLYAGRVAERDAPTIGRVRA